MSVREYYKQLKLDIEFKHITEPTFEERCEIFKCFPGTGSLAILRY